jgi:hypothetical protein
MILIFSKTVNRYLLCIHVYTHLKHPTEEQFGFRTKSSADKAIYKLTNEILKALNSRSLIGGIFCDLEEAFDCFIIKSYYLNWNFMV